jgi:uncharacterized protein YbbK (DUF523 family)
MYAVEIGVSFCVDGLCWRFDGSAYLLGAVSIVLEHWGKEFQFLVEGVLCVLRR